MSWRAAALLALLGIAAIPTVAEAIEPFGLPTVHVSVKPGSGSPRSRFVVSFKAEIGTGTIGSGQGIYRIAASVKARGKCQSSVSAVAPPSATGATVRVRLAPTGGRRWCSGTFRGEVWNTLIEPCPIGKACPAILPLPQIVGRFTFRVNRG